MGKKIGSLGGDYSIHFLDVNAAPSPSIDINYGGNKHVRVIKMFKCSYCKTKIKGTIWQEAMAVLEEELRGQMYLQQWEEEEL